MEETQSGFRHGKLFGTNIELPFSVGQDVYFLALIDVADDDRETSFHKEWVIRKKIFTVTMIQEEGKYYRSWAEAYQELKERKYGDM